MKVVTRVAVCMVVTSMTAGASGDARASHTVMFSEYVEGSGSNKALELVNPTAGAIDLGALGYVVEIYANGSATPTATIPLIGSIAPGDVHVLMHPSSPFAGVADQTSASLSFNGDDAVALRAAGVLLDSIGQAGFDPGTEWGAGSASTADNTLRRGCGCEADTDLADAFAPAGPWVGYAIDAVAGLGDPACDPDGACVATTVPVAGGVRLGWGPLKSTYR